MYERFFQLRERPFALSPDPDYLYPSRVHREALGYLRYGIESQAGFVVITGRSVRARRPCCRRSSGASTARPRSSA
jgi:general secretion pathway protein A